jgi:Protein of unknown function (DUF3060)
MWDILQMDDDDPEKRIRELERQLADVRRTPQSPPPAVDAPYTGEAPPAVDVPYVANPYDTSSSYAANPPYTANPPYAGNAPYTSGAPYPGTPQYGLGFQTPRRRRSFPRGLILLVLVFVLPTIISLVMHFARSTTSRSIFGTSDNGPTAVPQGGELRVGGNSTNRTIACNDGKLTLYGYGTNYSVTGHCAALTVGGYNNNVTVDSADALESTGYNNIITDHACNNGNLTLTSYGIAFNVTGHCASLTISSYNNQVTVDSVDTVNVSGYSNTVVYHSGKPAITDSGRDNNIQQG